MSKHSPTNTFTSVTSAGLMASAAALASIALVLWLDIMGGNGIQFVGILTSAPFLAASFAAPMLVGIVGGSALVGAYVYGDYRDSASTEAQLIRLAAIVIATLIAMLVSQLREKRERRLSALNDIAEVAQQAVLQPVPPRVGNVDCAVRYISAAAGARIGGDLYEVLATPFGTRAIVGDVKGKGLDAVRVASSVLGTFRHVAMESQSLPNVARALDSTVQRMSNEEDFVTAVIVELDSEGNATILNCGHPAPVLVEPEISWELTPAEYSCPLGLNCQPVEMELRVPSNVAILLYTDGLVETRNSSGEFFPMLDVMSVFKSSPTLDVALDSLCDLLLAHAGGSLPDDVAVMLLRPQPVMSTKPDVVLTGS